MNRYLGKAVWRVSVYTDSVVAILYIRIFSRVFISTDIFVGGSDTYNYRWVWFEFVGERVEVRICSWLLYWMSSWKGL